MRGEDIERLVDQHYASLYRFALSLCGNETDACDLAQEAYHLLARKGHQLNDPTKVKSWLFTTLYRLFLGQRRRLIRFPHHELDEVADELPEAPPEPPGRVDWQAVAEGLVRLD